jgi:AcrR family transcriptional regulator
MAEARKRRREEPEARRAQILEAARRTFRASGFHATTVDKIASEAGISVGLLYRFFASKSAIIQEMISADVQAQLDQIAGLIKTASAEPGQLPRLISEEVIATPLELDRFALQFEIAAEVCRDADLRDFVRSKYLELQQQIAAGATEWPGDRGLANALVEQMNMASAIGSGLAMHAILYLASPRLPTALVTNLMEVIFSQYEPDSRNP